ncbi:MAG TPA: hypothetical protein VFH61_04780 [Thermoleophilia bacterium]|nr:hypothetical protein [Thermoleophilia bacterium]
MQRNGQDVTWQGEPLGKLETSHITRILEAVRRGTWSSGGPCRVPGFVAEAMRVELRVRGEVDRGRATKEPVRGWETEEVDQSQAKQGNLFPSTPPDYTTALDAMGYTPPPLPLPAPWSPQATPEPSRKFTSTAREPMDTLKGDRLIAELQDEIQALRERNEMQAKLLTNGKKALRDAQIAAEREMRTLRRQRDDAQAKAARERGTLRNAKNRDDAKLRSIRRAARDVDLDEIEEPALIAWWRSEIAADWPELECLAISRLLAIAARGIDATALVPRRRRARGRKIQ